MVFYRHRDKFCTGVGIGESSHEYFLRRGPAQSHPNPTFHYCLPINRSAERAICILRLFHQVGDNSDLYQSRPHAWLS